MVHYSAYRTIYRPLRAAAELDLSCDYHFGFVRWDGRSVPSATPAYSPVWP